MLLSETQLLAGKQTDPDHAAAEGHSNLNLPHGGHKLLKLSH